MDVLKLAFGCDEEQSPKIMAHRSLEIAAALNSYSEILMTHCHQPSAGRVFLALMFTTHLQRTSEIIKGNLTQSCTCIISLFAHAPLTTIVVHE